VIEILISGVPDTSPRGPEIEPMESIVVNEKASAEVTMLLARAFDLAWERYYAAGQGPVVPQEVARSKLAAFLVEMEKSGVREEAALAACGVLHLIGLTQGQ
jgi:hypothetical protein